MMRFILWWWWLVPLVSLACDEGEVDLSVYVDSASVKDADSFSKSDPYCIVSAGDHSKKTKTLDDTNHPDWHETLEMGCVPTDATIEVHCLDDDGPGSKDDGLLDEKLEDWYADGANGAPYELGGSNHHVKIEVSWVEPPAPTAGPSLEPTAAPTPAPTVLVSDATDAYDVQYSESKLYDASLNGCYDSPRLGQRVELRDVTVVTSDFIVTRNGGPWRGLRIVEGGLSDEEKGANATAGSCYDVVRGVVEERDGETTLTKVVFLAAGKKDTCDPVAKYPARTRDFAGGCGDLGPESLEGVPVALRDVEAVVLETDLLQIDDRSGEPALAHLPAGLLLPFDDGLAVGDKLVVPHLEGVVVYGRFLDDSFSYALHVTSVADAVKVDAFTDAPTLRPTPRPTLEPTLRPTLEPTLRPTLEPTPRTREATTTKKKASSSHDGATVALVVVLVLILCAAAASFGVYYYYPEVADRLQGTGGPRLRRRIPRRPYSNSSRISEQTFEMGVVEAIGYDPNDLPGYHSASKPTRHPGEDYKDDNPLV